MTHSLQTLRTVLLGGILALVLMTTSRTARAQSFDLKETGWEGTKGLVDLARQELGDGRVVANGKLDWQALSPSDGLLILHPEAIANGEELATFLRAGGRVAVVDDFGAGDKILQRYGIKRVPAPKNPLYALRNNPNLAIAEPVSETVAGHRTGVHSVVADVTRLVTNHPTGLEREGLTTVLKIRASGEEDVALALAAVVEKGRLFAMGDPSSLINLMLRYPGNRAFAIGLVKYLVEEDGRQGRLYIVANRFEETGTYGSESGTSRELRDWVRSMSHEVRKIADEGLPKAAALSLAVLATAALVLWVASASAKTYRHPLPRFARAVPLVAQGGAAGRAAVLAAQTTHRGLILLEQKDALEEEIGALLGMEKAPMMGVAMEELAKRKLLDPATFAELKKAFLEMAKVETAVASGNPIRISREDLIRAERVANDVIAQISKASAGKKGAES